MSGIADEDIAVRVQNGDSEAFGELMRRYESKLQRYGTHFVSQPDVIDDAVQETFIRAYRNIKSFDTGKTFSPWIYRIAHNVYVNILRTTSRSGIFAVDLDTFLPHLTYEDTADRLREQKDMRALLEASLGLISSSYREVLVLYYFEELSYKEIAEVVHIPIGTVAIRLARARKALEKHIPPELHD